MKPKTLMGKQCVTLAMIMSVLFLSADIAYSDKLENQADRFYRNGQRVMGPGWLNADLHKNYKIKAVLDDVTPEPDSKSTQTNNKFSDRLKEMGMENGKIRPDLKQKSSMGEENTFADTIIIPTDAVDLELDISVVTAVLNQLVEHIDTIENAGDANLILELVRAMKESGKQIRIWNEGATMICVEFIDPEKPAQNEADRDIFRFNLTTSITADFHVLDDGRAILALRTETGIFSVMPLELIFSSTSPALEYVARNFSSIMYGANRLEQTSFVGGKLMGFFQNTRLSSEDLRGLSYATRYSDGFKYDSDNLTSQSITSNKESDFFNGKDSANNLTNDDKLLDISNIEIVIDTPNGKEAIDADRLLLIFINLFENGMALIPDGKFDEMKGIIALLNQILNNPTDEQRVILGILQSILEETKKMKSETGNAEIQKTSDDFVKMVATCLLAQALHDLLKEGDITSLKAMFIELDNDRSRILSEYDTSVSLYYTNIIKEFASSMALLQLKDIAPNQVDEIIRKLKDSKDKTFTEEEILKNEVAYRKLYLDKAREALENSMKTMLEAYTKRIMGVLEGTGVVKKKRK
jgi:uncharacterized protein YnzC (UPF0291/DUF896 family)